MIKKLYKKICKYLRSRKNCGMNLRTGLTITILLSGMTAVSIFVLLFENIGACWMAVRNFPPFYFDEAALVEQLRRIAPNYTLTEYDKGKNMIDSYEGFFDVLDEYTFASLYGTEDGLYRCSSNVPAFFEEFYQGGIVDSLFERIEYQIFMYDKEAEHFYDMEFANGTGSVYIRSFHDILFILPFIIFLLLLSLVVFLAPILHYINKKVRAIHYLKDEILLMASGDLTHPVSACGSDEIGILSKELDSLRIALIANIEKEIESRRANQDLITAMSHDLRTPLTILKGYLEILKLKEDNAAKDDYLMRCLKKTDDITAMTDRMFEYALVFDENETIEKEQIPMQFLLGCIRDNLEFISLVGFHIMEDESVFQLAETRRVLIGDDIMLKRICNNLFSNILKYGDKAIPVTLDADLTDTQLVLTLTNGCKAGCTDISGNGIGLRSTAKMVELHGGSLHQKSTKQSYAVTLTFPLTESIS